MNIPQTNDLPDNDPRHHALNLSAAIKAVAEHAREDIAKVDDHGAHLLYELTAEVLENAAHRLDVFVSDCEQDLAIQQATLG